MKSVGILAICTFVCLSASPGVLCHRFPEQYGSPEYYPPGGAFRNYYEPSHSMSYFPETMQPNPYVEEEDYEANRRPISMYQPSFAGPAPHFRHFGAPAPSFSPFGASAPPFAPYGAPAPPFAPFGASAPPFAPYGAPAPAFPQTFVPFFPRFAPFYPLIPPPMFPDYPPQPYSQYPGRFSPPESPQIYSPSQKPWSSVADTYSPGTSASKSFSVGQSNNRFSINSGNSKNIWINGAPLDPLFHHQSAALTVFSNQEATVILQGSPDWIESQGFGGAPALMPMLPNCWGSFPGTKAWNRCFAQFNAEMQEFGRRVGEAEARERNYVHGLLESLKHIHKFPESGSDTLLSVNNFGLQTNGGVTYDMIGGHMRTVIDIGSAEEVRLHKSATTWEWDALAKGQLSTWAVLEIPLGVDTSDIKSANHDGKLYIWGWGQYGDMPLPDDAIVNIRKVSWE